MTSQQQKLRFVDLFVDNPDYKNDGVHNRLVNHVISSIQDPILRGIDSRFHHLIANHENYETQKTPLDDTSIIVFDNRDEDDMQELEGVNNPEVDAIEDEEDANTIDLSTLNGKQLKFYKRDRCHSCYGRTDCRPSAVVAVSPDMNWYTTGRTILLGFGVLLRSV